jgi:hypothetical protein
MEHEINPTRIFVLAIVASMPGLRKFIGAFFLVCLVISSCMLIILLHGQDLDHVRMDPPTWTGFIVAIGSGIVLIGIWLPATLIAAAANHWTQHDDE